jgi:hypothetical protein
MVYNENAPLLVQRGYYPLPTAPVDFKPSKSPVRWIPSLNKFTLLSGWNTRTAPILDPQPGANIGVRCGGGLVAFDYDDEEAALAICEAFDPSPVNKAGQRAWTPFYRADFDVPSEDFFDSNGRKVLQILSTGRQTVIPPSIHPDTKDPYRWTNGKSLYDTALTELPLLPRDYRERILALGYTAKRTLEPVEKVDPETGEITNGFDDGPCAELNDVAIKNLSAWVPELNIYECRRRVGRTASYEGVAQWRDSTTGKTLEERDLNLKISGRGIKDFGDDRGYSALDLVMAARSCSLFEAFEWLEQRVLPKRAGIEVDWDNIANSDDAPSIAPEDGSENNGEERKADEQPKDRRRRINPRPLILPLERDVPRRQFLYGMHYMRGTVSGTIGTGGTGKSTLGLIEAIGMAVGRDLLGNEKFKAPLRVWYHNAEETMEELVRRCVAICKRFEISRDELEENFLVTNGFETPIKVANGGRDVKIDAGLRKEIIDVIGELKIDAVIFDPLVAMHRVHEDFNSALDPVIRDAFGKIAHDTNCAIDLCHHTRKKPAGHDGEYTVADSRGGQSLIDALRGARVLNTMSKTEATNFDLREDDRFDYMRLSRGKANMVRRGTIGWYRFVPIELDNGSEDEGVAGDTVAVLERWTPPQDSDLVRQPTYEDRKYWLGALQYGEYRYDSRSPDWFGFKIADRLGADRNDPKQMKVVAAILDDLIEEGTFKIESRKDARRMLREFVVPGVLAGIDP